MNSDLVYTFNTSRHNNILQKLEVDYRHVSGCLCPLSLMVEQFFSPNLQLTHNRIQATYSANFVTIFAMVQELQPFVLKITLF